MRTSACFLVGALVLAACNGGPEADTVESPVSSASSPLLDLLARTRADALRDDGRIDATEMRRLVTFAGDGSADGRNPAAVAFIEAMLANDATRILPPALAFARAQLSATTRGPGLDTASYRVVERGTGSFVFDDELFVLADGATVGRPSLIGHSRGYAAYRDGVLRVSHGSPAPSSRAMTEEESRAVRSQTSGQALDRAASLAGVDLGSSGYSYFAEKVHYKPGANTPYWEGLCHAWTTAALDDRLSLLVDVEGAPGRRGVWFMGQWISRADLGNWTMGTYDALSVIDAVTVDSFVRPENWIKGLIVHGMNGKGLRADLWNDEDQRANEVWNQPILHANMKVASVTPEVAQQVIAHATADRKRWEPLPKTGAKVKLVTATAEWAVETSDAHEEGVSVRTSTWNVYVVTDDAGKVARGYMAHLLPASLGPLPTRESASLPDYFAYPTHATIDSILAGEKNATVAGAYQGKILKFFVGEVLTRGIPGATREAFEREAIGAAPASSDSLRTRFPGVANAYSKAQWDRTFGASLGDGSAFGAVWATAPRP